MDKQERTRYLLGLKKEELELLAEDKMASAEMREEAQRLLSNLNRTIPPRSAPEG